MKKNNSSQSGKVTRRSFIKQSLAATSAAILSATFSKSLFSQDKHSSSTKIISNFREPYGIALGSEGRIYVSDASGYCIKIFSKTGEHIKTFGQPGSSGDKFNYPQGIAVDEDGLIYIMDSNNGRVVIYDQNAEYLTSFGTIGGYPNAFYTPKGILVRNKIYVCNTRNHYVTVFDKTNFELLDKFGELGDDPPNLEAGSLEYKFRLPTDVAITDDGRILVADSKHGQIKILDEKGQFLSKFGEVGSAPGQMNFPEGIALDSEQNIYVCDALNARIQKFTLDGEFIGSMSKGVSRPTNLAIDTNNKFYIVDANLKQVIITDWKADRNA